MSDQNALRKTETALRATSDTLLANLEELSALEHEKRTLKPGDPRLVELAEQIERLAVLVLSGSTEERVLTQDAAVEVAVQGPTAPRRAIEDVEPREPHEILKEWREAERRAEAVERDSPEAATLATELERLRFEYRRAHERFSRRE